MQDTLESDRCVPRARAWSKVSEGLENIRHAFSLTGPFLDGRIEEVSELVLTADELEATRALVGDERTRRFIQLWTLKEAYLKALGVGLALSPKSFSFRWGEQGPELTSPHNEPPDRRRTPGGQGRASSARTWHFRLAMLGGENQLAVGVYAPGTPSVRIGEYIDPLCS
jgi:hypothetical protein